MDANNDKDSSSEPEVEIVAVVERKSKGVKRRRRHARAQTDPPSPPQQHKRERRVSKTRPALQVWHVEAALEFLATVGGTLTEGVCKCVWPEEHWTKNYDRVHHMWRKFERVDRDAMSFWRSLDRTNRLRLFEWYVHRAPGTLD